MGGICLPIYPSQEVHTVPKGPLRERASERAPLFFGGEVFSWIAWGNLQQQQQKKSVWIFLYLFFLEGAFWYCCCCWVLLGAHTLSLSFSFFPGRASLEEGLKERKERRERQYKVYFPTIFSSASEGEERRTFREVRRKKYWVFCIYIFIYFYVIYIYIYYLVVFSCCVDREKRERKRRRRIGREKGKQNKKTYTR